MRLTNVEVESADEAFSRQVSSQAARITMELKKLEYLLEAGQVDRRVLTDFRSAVDRIRSTSWHVQQWLDGGSDTSASLPSSLLQERVRLARQLLTQLATDLTCIPADPQEISQLLDAAAKLTSALQSKA